MIKTEAIRNVKKESFTVTWNVGRRCNFDCTYCEPHFHNDYSKYKEFDEFKRAYDFVEQWLNLYNVNDTTISFTGGEPTIHKGFWELLEYIPDNIYVGVTTNGAWGPTNTKRLIDNADSVTVSYHAEVDPRLKAQVIENIFAVSKSRLRLQVNLMMHMDYWDECVDLYNKFKAEGIDVHARPIGDGNVVRKGWFIDSEGNNRKTNHEYTPEQQEWIWSTKGLAFKASTTSEGSQLGRSCCGGRCLEGKVEGTWQPITMINTEFKGWYCSVDKYFLHIDQETNLVYHHQTCQALHNGQKGPVGSLDDPETMLSNLRKHLENPTPIVCPNERCGCGMCVPKAKTLEDYEKLN